jgi:hypothetical protein
MGVLSGVAFGGALLILLPRLARRIIISLLVLYHFGGILASVTSVPPPGRDPSWLVNQIWMRLYRPYLQFTYLYNAYHFYSPEPGPATLLWVRLEYADGTSQWLEIPRREDYQTRLEYQRRLALTESVNHPFTPSLIHAFLFEKRLTAGSSHHPRIPIYPPELLAPPAQYSELPFPKKQLLASYVRQLARTHPHPTNPEIAIKNLKVYRVVHNIIMPKQLGDGVSPLHPTFYLPFYQGTFNSDGQWLARDGSLLTPTLEEIEKMSTEEQVREQLSIQKRHAEQDPFLFWVIPILPVDDSERDPTRPPRLIQLPGKPPPSLHDLEIIDYVKIHAGDRKPKAADK